MDMDQGIHPNKRYLLMKALLTAAPQFESTHGLFWVNGLSGNVFLFEESGKHGLFLSNLILKVHFNLIGTPFFLHSPSMALSMPRSLRARSQQLSSVTLLKAF
jgi:hypothetical protein